MPQDLFGEVPVPPKKEKKKKLPKFYADILAHSNGGEIVPAQDSPICLKCGLHGCGATTPYMRFFGSTNPLITFVFEGVSKGDDAKGTLGNFGTTSLIYRKLTDLKIEGFDFSQVRFCCITRCYARNVNVNIKGNWCRHFLVQDLLQHTPKMIVTLGSPSLGLLCHKSNAQEWGGKILTYRGWPDDWITNEKFDNGHPVFGAKPDWKIPIYPLQAPGIVFATKNPKVTARWNKQIARAVRYAIRGVTVPTYIRDWYNISLDKEEIKATLTRLIEHKADKGIVTYDTETTGLKMFNGASHIVFLMFRWDENGVPYSIGFPWEYPESPLAEHVRELTPYVLRALYKNKLQGHNLTFDVLFTYATLEGASLESLTAAMHADTWHMLFAEHQQKGSLGLELVAYKWCAELAGYEEEMTMLIEKHGELLNPAKGKGGHYAKCPRELWDTHLKPYVMGDVEVCHTTANRVRETLLMTEGYKIPLASMRERGKFRWFRTPNRDFVYHKIMVPASIILARLMGRGMYVDTNELTAQEELFPKQLLKAKSDLRKVDERILQWCEQNEATIPDWELDLENKAQLKTILFNILGLPVQRLTAKGNELFAFNKHASPDEMAPYAAVDKFTLNALLVKHQELAPLKKYRQIYKLYTTYVRPLRNYFNDLVDKKERKSFQHLMADQCVHTEFVLTGTSSGRTSSRNPNLQQLPKDGIVKRIYKSRFLDDGCLYQGDLSQIELRLLAAACGDRSMVNAYVTNQDLHSLTQSKIYHRPYEHCLKEYIEWCQNNNKDNEAKQIELERRVSKMVNFLTGYGGGAFGLMNVLAAQGVNLSSNECEGIIESFFDNYPALRQHIAYYKRFILDNGCAVSLFGRIRWFEEVYGQDEKATAKALRSGYNHLIQSSASDMMMLCLYWIEMKMREANLESILISTVHDSLVIDAKINELDTVHGIVKDTMENIPLVIETLLEGYNASWMKILPFGGDYECGPDYLRQKKTGSGSNIDWHKLLADAAKPASKDK